MQRRSIPRISAMVVALLALASALMLPPVSRAADEPSTPSMKLKVGEMAPDFSLKDQSGKEVSLHDFKGKKSVVVAFYVFAFTGG